MSNRIVSPQTEIVPIQTTDDPDVIINPIPVTDDGSFESVSISPDGEVMDRQVEILDPAYDPLEKAPEDVLRTMHEFGVNVANTPENVPPVKLAGMIVVHAVYMEQKRRKEAAGESIPDLSKPSVEDEDNGPKFSKKYD